MEHGKTKGREFAMQFLYKCEQEKMFHFSDSRFRTFAEFYELDTRAERTAHNLAKGTLDNLDHVNRLLGEASTGWRLPRMSATDRAILRQSVYELLERMTPDKVVLNEAINLAKVYGTENSGRFVNGVLDAVRQRLRSSNEEKQHHGGIDSNADA